MNKSTTSIYEIHFRSIIQFVGTGDHQAKFLSIQAASAEPSLPMSMLPLCYSSKALHHDICSASAVHSSSKHNSTVRHTRQ